jgi:hypothetical protein
VALHPEDLRWSAAVRVTWPWDEELEVLPGITLWLTGGHFDGHTVLHDSERALLLCGDALKFELGPGDPRRALAVSAHKAFVRGIPLTHGELRRYRAVFAQLGFSRTWSPFEYPSNVGRDEVLALIDRFLAGRPSPDPVALAGLVPGASAMNASSQAPDAGAGGECRRGVSGRAGWPHERISHRRARPPWRARLCDRRLRRARTADQQRHRLRSDP